MMATSLSHEQAVFTACDAGSPATESYSRLWCVWLILYTLSAIA